MERMEDEFLRFHKKAIRSSKSLIRRNIEVGVAGGAMFGAGLTGDVLAAFTENPYIGVPSTAVLIMGGILVRESLADLETEINNVLDEQAKVSKVEKIS